MEIGNEKLFWTYLIYLLGRLSCTNQSEIDGREKIVALNLAKEVYLAKLDLLTNCTVANDAVKFITSHKRRCINDNEETREDKEKVEEEEEVVIVTK